MRKRTASQRSFALGTSSFQHAPLRYPAGREIHRRRPSLPRLTSPTWLLARNCQCWNDLQKYATRQMLTNPHVHRLVSLLWAVSRQRECTTHLWLQRGNIYFGRATSAELGQSVNRSSIIIASASAPRADGNTSRSWRRQPYSDFPTNQLSPRCSHFA